VEPPVGLRRDPICDVLIPRRDPDDPIRLLERQRLQQHGIDDREGDGAGRDPDGEHEDDEQRGCRRRTKPADSIAEHETGRSDSATRAGPERRTDRPEGLHVHPQPGPPGPPAGGTALAQFLEHVADLGCGAVARRHHFE
jgi:hypothetical protein